MADRIFPDHPHQSGYRSYNYGGRGTLWVRDYIITSERYKPLGCQRGIVMALYRHLLLAVDFSPESNYIGERAKALADASGARITLIHVVEHVPLDLSNDLVLAQPVNIDQELLEDARSQLGALADELDLGSSPRIVELGSTKGEILRIAEENEVDLIVVGSHGRHGLALLMGSTANAVLHGAKCDVLAVRVPEQANTA